MQMFDGIETPEGIIDLIKRKIRALGGLEKAFPHNRRIQLYSGPNRDFLEKNEDGTSKIIGNGITNQERAKKQAREEDWQATLIDDTPVGKFLYAWFNEIYKNETSYEIKRGMVDRAAKQVMTYVSGVFIHIIGGEVRTAVCGARRDRVFCETEATGIHDRAAFAL